MGSNDSYPKEAQHLGKAGWMDIDGLLVNAKLMSKVAGKPRKKSTGFKRLSLWIRGVGGCGGGGGGDVKASHYLLTA